MPTKNQINPSRAELDEMMQTLEKAFMVWPQLKTCVARLRTQDDAEPQRRQESYVQLAIAVLAEIGHPTPITVLLERIRERRNDPTITRGSVETSLLRHLNSKGDQAEVVKPRPGTYDLRRKMAVV